MKTFSTFFVLLFCFIFNFSVFGQWDHLPQNLNSATLKGLNTGYPGFEDSGVLIGNFAGYAKKFNKATQVFTTITGVPSKPEFLYRSSDGLMRLVGPFGIAKLNTNETAVTTFEYTSTGSIEKAFEFGGQTLVYGSNLTNINGTPLSGAHSVALLQGGTVTNLPQLVPNHSSEIRSIKYIGHNGSAWILLGNTTDFGGTPAIDGILWDGTTITPIGGLPTGAGQYAVDLENGILGHSTGPFEWTGSSVTGSSMYPLKIDDVVTAGDGSTWIFGTKLSSGSNGRIASNSGGAWHSEEGNYVLPAYQNGTLVSLYCGIPFADCMIAGSNGIPPYTGCVFLAQTCSTVLPIKLISFEGINTLQGNKLTWETESETNNLRFEIESSENGENFEKIGSVRGENYASNYKFLDENSKINNYYRLKQIDYDGQFEYSKIIFVKNINSFEEKVYPNPFMDYINIQTKESEISITDILGKIIFYKKQETDEITSTQVDLSNLVSGTYILNMGSKKQKIIK